VTGHQQSVLLCAESCGASKAPCPVPFSSHLLLDLLWHVQPTAHHSQHVDLPLQGSQSFSDRLPCCKSVVETFLHLRFFSAIYARLEARVEVTIVPSPMFPLQLILAIRIGTAPNIVFSHVGRQFTRQLA
jgi:hypothetical protein